MTPEKMLQLLHRAGYTGLDFEGDGDEPEGSFIWGVENGVLAAEFEADDDLSETRHAWRLVPVETDGGA